MAEAELILSKVYLPAAATYLAGYGVECVLKALMIVVSPLKERPELLDVLKKDFGHSLHRLRLGLIERGVHVSATVTRTLTYLSTWSPDLRYDPGPGDPREAARFLKEARAIVVWADRRI